MNMLQLQWRNLIETDEVPLPPIYSLVSEQQKRRRHLSKLFQEGKIPSWGRIVFTGMMQIPCFCVKRWEEMPLAYKQKYSTLS